MPIATTDCTVRITSADEAERVAAFGAALFRETYGPTHPEPTLSQYLASAFDPARYGSMLRDPATSVLVAESPGSDWIGYVHLRAGAPGESMQLHEPLAGMQPLEIVRFYVEPAWHGRGIAQRLLAAADAEARARGADVIWLQAWQEATQALAFYRKSGFRVIGSTTFHFGERRDSDFVLARPVPGGPHRPDSHRR